MWAAERPDGGRGFGFTGGHFHKNWADDNFRKIVLNAILWSARVDIPANGVESRITEDDLKANLDAKK
jgi:type 1 glutamine amidotransferase